MGKGYKRKTRWRTLNIGAPPGEEDEEDGKLNGQAAHRTGHTDSAESTAKDHDRNYASVLSGGKNRYGGVVTRSKSDHSGSSRSQPKIIFNESEYTRITTPRQDVLFKKGYLSRTTAASITASLSETPSTTESQSASHSTADGSETTEDPQLLDYQQNETTKNSGMVPPQANAVYGTVYDNTSGYYCEYPMMMVGPMAGVPGPAMHNVLTAIPCAPVPLRPIEWVNPAFVPNLNNMQHFVMDYQTPQEAQYPTVVDGTENESESVSSLIEEIKEKNEKEKTCVDGSETESTTTSATATTTTTTTTTTQNGTEEKPSDPAVEEDVTAEEQVYSENYLETDLAHQLHMTHVAMPAVPQPYMYPGHYMFGPSLVNVNGVTVQCEPMLQDTSCIWVPMNNQTFANRKTKRHGSRGKWRYHNRRSAQSTTRDEERDDDNSSETEYHINLWPRGAKGSTAADGSSEHAGNGVFPSANAHQPLNLQCPEFRSMYESRVSGPSADGESSDGTQSNCEASSSNHQSRDKASKSAEKSIALAPSRSLEATDSTVFRKSVSSGPQTRSESSEKLVSRLDEEVEAAPVEFAAEVFANVTNIADRSLVPRSVFEGTLMETEIGVDATSVEFKEIVRSLELAQSPEEKARSRMGSVEKETVPNGQASVEVERALEKSSTTNGTVEHHLPNVSESKSGKQHREVVTPNAQRGSRSVSPGLINCTTTPINAMSQRLPDNYQSLFTRASSSSPLSTSNLQQSSRNRKYSAKSPKFVREATPGPDLDGVLPQHAGVDLEDETRMRKSKKEVAKSSEPIVIEAEAVIRGPFNNNEAIATGIDAIEAEVQGHSMSTSGSFYEARRDVDAKEDADGDASNGDSGVESQTRFSSEHPITNAVTDWLQQVNSAEIFTRSDMGSESEPEDDELEEEKPSKNLQGNPMPALSANSSVNDARSSRLASCGEFARVIEVPVVERTARRERDIEEREMSEGEGRKKCEGVAPEAGSSRRARRTKAKRRALKKRSSGTKSEEGSNKTTAPSASPRSDANVETARVRVQDEIADGKSVLGKKKYDEVCELAEKDSVVGMRVAKSTRKNVKSREVVEDSEGSRGVESRHPMRTRDKSNVEVLSSREVPVENVEVMVRRLTDENDEGIVEDEEVNVRTFEQGEIVVSVEGKMLPAAAYETPVFLQHQQPQEEPRSPTEIHDQPKFRKITCEKSRCEDTTSSASETTASKRNSLGSIEEPDVLECWEIETVEPITTPKKQLRGTCLEGEAAEDDAAGTNVDPEAAEIVRKYYRLEAMRDSVTSAEEEDPGERETRRRNSLPNSPERMIESLCSEEIPAIDERMSKIVEKLLNDSGIPVEEAVEVYESCYTGKPPAYLLGFDTKFRRNGTLYGLDPEREGNAPCKAACCNIQ